MSEIFQVESKFKDHPGRYGYGRSVKHRLKEFNPEWQGKTPRRVELVIDLMTGPAYMGEDNTGMDGWSRDYRRLHSGTTLDVSCNCFGSLDGYTEDKKPPTFLPEGSYIVIDWWEE